MLLELLAAMACDTQMYWAAVTAQPRLVSGPADILSSKSATLWKLVMVGCLYAYKPWVKMGGERKALLAAQVRPLAR